MLFFSSPTPIYKEIAANSVGITPHNFSKGLKSSEVYGKYCVQFTYFKNDLDGMKALKWWKDSCIDWCYARMENGKYGDQKYLDYFEHKFNNVCIISHIGAGVAPWNISNYNLTVNSEILLVERRKFPKSRQPLIFYHFQGLKFKEKNNVIISEPSVLKIKPDALKYIYIPYIDKLLSIKNQIDGNLIIYQKIVFRRKIYGSIRMFFRINLKRFTLIRVLYKLFQKSRYNRLKDIGSTLT
jgi:hypothetical protein